MKVALLLLGHLTLTSYRSIPQQTDNTPFITATGERVSKYGCAISQDILCPLAHGKARQHDKHKCPYQYSHIHYGDWLYIPGFGLRCVNDAMNARHKGRIDLWVASYKEEKKIGTRHLDIYVLQGADL